MQTYAILVVLLGLTFWKPRISLYLFVLASPLVSIYQDAGSDPRLAWAFLLALRSALPSPNLPRVNMRIVIAAAIFFVVEAIVLKLNAGGISDQGENSAWSFFVYFIAGAAFMFAASRLANTKEEVLRTLVFLGFGVVEVCAYAVLQGYRIYVQGAFERVGSTLINPNTLAAYMNVSAITLLSARRLSARKSWQIFAWAVAVAATLALFLSLSRAGLIAFLVGLVLLWATATGKLTLKKSAAAVVVSCILALLAYTAIRTYRVQKAAAESSPDQKAITEISQSMEDFTRYEAATFALEQWTMHPFFGVGFMRFPEINYTQTGIYATTHDTVLQLLVGTGLFGVAMIAFISKQLWEGLKRPARIVFLPIAATVTVNSLFGDFLGSIEMMGAVSLAYLLCKYLGDFDPGGIVA